MSVEQDHFDGATFLELGSRADGDGEIPLARVRARFEQIQKDQVGDAPLYILVARGSMCPPHKSHVGMLEAARKVYESSGRTVLFGLLAPQDDMYIRRKLGEEAIASNHRINMCRLACLQHEWIDVAGFGALQSMESMDVMKAVGCQVARALGVPPTRVKAVPVYGSDTWLHRLTRADHCGGVCVCRSGDREAAAILARYEKLKAQNPKRVCEDRFNDVFLVHESDGPPNMSSTQFRKVLASNRSLDAILAHPKLRGCVCSSVVKYILEHSEDEDWKP